MRYFIIDSNSKLVGAIDGMPNVKDLESRGEVAVLALIDKHISELEIVDGIIQEKKIDQQAIAQRKKEEQERKDIWEKVQTEAIIKMKQDGYEFTATAAAVEK